MEKKTAKTTLTIRVDQEWLDALDAWIASQELKPTRTEAVRVAVNKLIQGAAPKQAAKRPSKKKGDV